MSASETEEVLVLTIISQQRALLHLIISKLIVILLKK